MNKPPVAEQQGSNDNSVDKREVVTMQQFLSDMNGGARIYDYRLFAGVEPVGSIPFDVDSVIGVVMAVNYEIIAEGAPEAPEMLGDDLVVKEAFWDWHRKYVLKREAHHQLTAEELTRPIAKVTQPRRFTLSGVKIHGFEKHAGGSPTKEEGLSLRYLTATVELNDDELELIVNLQPGESIDLAPTTKVERTQ